MSRLTEPNPMTYFTLILFPFLSMNSTPHNPIVFISPQFLRKCNEIYLALTPGGTKRCADYTRSDLIFN